MLVTPEKMLGRKLGSHSGGEAHVSLKSNSESSSSGNYLEKIIRQVGEGCKDAYRRAVMV